MRKNVKRLLPVLFVLFLVVALLPQAFASDNSDIALSSYEDNSLAQSAMDLQSMSDSLPNGEANVEKALNEYADLDNENDLCTSLDDEVMESNDLESDYDYETYTEPSSINFVKGDSPKVFVYANCTDLGDLEEGDAVWKVYINGDEGGNKTAIDATVRSFEFDLSTIENYLVEGENTITFHPNQGALEFLSYFDTFNYIPLIVNYTSNVNYDYQTSPSPSSLNYNGGSSLVNISAIFSSLGDLEEGMANWKVFINGDTAGIDAGVDATVSRFEFDLSTIENYLVEGENSITFHPNQGTLESNAYFDSFNYIPLTVHYTKTVSSEYDYETIVSVSELNYTRGNSVTVEVTAFYEDDGAFDMHEYDAMYVYVNDVNSYSLSPVHAGDKSFVFNLAIISDFLEEGMNTLVFHPSNSTLSSSIPGGKYRFNPLTVYVNSSQNPSGNDLSSDYDYETFVNPAVVDYNKGESFIINVTAVFNESEISIPYYSAMYVWVNGEVKDLNNYYAGVSADYKQFEFDLLDISDMLVDGANNITFHPDAYVLTDNGANNYSFNTLVVNVLADSEYIYVSPDGDDYNDGSFENPVETITQAIALVKTTGITNIRILNGTYCEYGIIIDTSCNIEGVGEVIIDAEQRDRIFFIDGMNEVKLSNLALINGYAPTDGFEEDATHGEISFYAAGGAIFVNETYLTIDNLTFINNFAEHFGGAINVEADNFKIYNSRFENNTAGVYGGAMDAEGGEPVISNCIFIGNDCNNGGALGLFAYHVIISDSYFENNTASDGGAIYIQNLPWTESEYMGNFIINNTFFNNSAVQQGGAINVENYGSYSYNWNYTQIKNNTFIKNYGFNGGAIASYLADTASLDNYFENNTAGYGGAIAAISVGNSYLRVGELYLRGNTIVNCSASESGNAIYSLSFISSRINITFIGGETIHSNGEAVELNVSVCDDMGNPISGMPVNFTVGGVLTPNDPTNLTEGIGTVRFVPHENGTFTVSGIYGSRNDMGWYNVVNGTLVVENASEDYFGIIYLSKNGNDDNVGSIDKPVLTFDQAYHLATREGGSREIVIYEGTYSAYGYKPTKSLKITGIGNPTLDAQNQNAVFVINGEYDHNFTFTGLNFINGVGGSTNSGYNRGGAIFIMGGNLYLDNDTFKSNSALDGGGALYANKGLDSWGYSYPANVLITNCYFENNYGTEDGGAIGLYDCDVVVINSTFNSNNAKGGGAISIAGRFGGAGNLTVINSSFYNNVASYEGGAILGEAIDTYAVKYFLLVENSYFKNNEAVYGGAIYGGNANISYCTFINNKANNEGGAVVLKDNDSFIRYSIFNNNNANNGTQYYGNSSSINDNFWGLNYDSMEQLFNGNVIYLNDSEGFDSWANIKITGPAVIGLDNYTYTIQFVSNDGNELDCILPDCLVGVYNNKSQANSIDSNEKIISGNVASLVYFGQTPIEDVISVYNYYMYSDDFITSLAIEVKNETIVINDTNGTNGSENAIGTSKDLQDLIDSTPLGGVLDLMGMSFENVSDIKINKSISIVGGTISSGPLNSSSAGSGSGSLDIGGVHFFIVDANSGFVSINNLTVKANSNDTIIKMLAINDTNPSLIDTAEVHFDNNSIEKISEDVDASSISLLEIESERAVLSSNSTISLSCNNVPSGINSLKLSFAGSNDGSIGFTGANEIVNDAKKIATKIIFKNPSFYTVNKTLDGKVAKYFTITLKDNKGNALKSKAIQFVFNGKIYKVTTNAKGQAKLNVAKAYKGTYYIVASFLGDNNYDGSIISAKIKFNPQKVKLTVPKKTYKANKKVKKLTATLKNAKGKAIKGKKITFTVNNKKYTAKTNKKGVATVKVKLSKKKTFTVSVKFAGDKTYKKITKKSKVTIK